MNETVMTRALVDEQVEKQWLNLWLYSTLSLSTHHPFTPAHLPSPPPAPRLA